MLPVGSITLHRADMLKVLTDNLPSTEILSIHFSMRLISYAQDSDSVTLHFADGSAAQADILIGADGMKSVTRAVMYGNLAKREQDPQRAAEMEKYINASWSGTYGYRSLVKKEELESVWNEHLALKETISVRQHSIPNQPVLILLSLRSGVERARWI